MQVHVKENIRSLTCTSRRQCAQGVRQRAGSCPVAHSMQRAQRYDVPGRAQGSSSSSAAVTDSSQPSTSGRSEAFYMQAKMNFLREDLEHLFDDQGIDANSYEEVVDFQDPITKYTSLAGYLYNIKMLKQVFDPKFILHDMRPSGPSAIITRWTMTMPFTPARALPKALRKYWSPELSFTGTSEYVFNPASGKICRHIDTWDSIKNQEYFSLEAFADFLRQVATLGGSLDLETPQYTLLRRAKDYEVRRYQPFTVAETVMDAVTGIHQATLESGGVQVNPAGPGMKAFRALAGYLFGGNAQRESLAMTTPVFTDTRGRMQFVVGDKEIQARGSRGLPSPLPSSGVNVIRMSGGLYAVRRFSGMPSEADAVEQAAALRSSLQRDGMPLAPTSATGQGYSLARYNDPSTPGPVRRNEVLIELDAQCFNIWGNSQ